MSQSRGRCKAGSGENPNPALGLDNVSSVTAQRLDSCYKLFWRGGPSLSELMISPVNYSARTVCPECHGRVALERVAFTATFACSNCGEHIHISDRYRRAFNWIGWILGLVIPFILGVRSWILLLTWVPCSMTVIAIWAYAGKYALPPKLEKCAIDLPSTLHLGPR